MPSWVFTVLGAAAIAAVSIAAHIRIRFAPDEATAHKRVFDLIETLFRWLGNLVLVTLLVIEAFSHRPVTRLDMVLIALMAAALAFSLLAGLLQELLKALLRGARITKEHVEVTGTLIEALGELTDRDHS